MSQRLLHIRRVIQSSAVVVGGTTLAACGGGPRHAADCASLTASEIERVALVQPSRREMLAKAPASRELCSVVFLDSAGALIVQLSVATGGSSALAALRRGTAEIVATTPRPVPSLGEGAFVAKRIVGFVRGGRLVELQAGYSAAGRLELSPRELVHLAQVVADKM
jgi:hypothetical protein